MPDGKGDRPLETVALEIGHEIPLSTYLELVAQDPDSEAKTLCSNLDLTSLRLTYYGIGLGHHGSNKSNHNAVFKFCN